MGITRLHKTFSFSVGDGRKGPELLAAGRYGFVGAAAGWLVEEEDFPIAPEPGEIEIEFFEIGGHGTHHLGDIIEQIEMHGLKYPTMEDTLRFGEKYPEEQKVRRLVFPARPFREPFERSVLFLGHDPTFGRSFESIPWRTRGEIPFCFPIQWPAGYRFAARR